MLVYLKNCRGEQTVRDLTLRNILRILLYQWFHVPKEERATVKILL